MIFRVMHRKLRAIAGSDPWFTKITPLHFGVTSEIKMSSFLRPLNDIQILHSCYLQSHASLPIKYPPLSLLSVMKFGGHIVRVG